MKDVQLTANYGFKPVDNSLIGKKMILNAFFLIIEDIYGNNWVYDCSQVPMISILPRNITLYITLLTQKLRNCVDFWSNF